MDAHLNGKTERRNLALYSSGKIISVFGTSIYNFAISFYVLKLTGSALSFTITLLLGTLPMILINPFAGVIADKVNKKKMVILMEILSGILLISVYLISSFSGLNLLLIYITAFCLTIFVTFFGVGMEAAKPNIVSSKKLMNINSIGKIIDSVSSILGPMLGGMVFAFFDIRTFIIFSGICFLISGFSMMFIDFNFNKELQELVKKTVRIDFIEDIKDGFHYLYERKNIMGLFLILISLNFFLSFAVTIPIPYIINTILELGSGLFGVIQASLPLGLIAGALVVKKITERMPYSKLMRLLTIFLSICMIATGFPLIFESASFSHMIYGIYYCLLMFCFGIVIAFIDIPIAYFMQKEIPEEYRGRVMSIGISIGKIMTPVAMVVSGFLLELIPPYTLPIGGGILYLLITLINSRKIPINLSTKLESSSN
ncbi:MFS transporter [Ureibacillus sinduriensis]|uniref:Permease n=1 Tax=Ureibacillus sinduriensis BLB-1 = JCM 15800 TaxID=1384057 RepID=A0A0A3HWP4_9BACL|nr:MFS transporter [Ureibacillus sinduriensis]KGR75645.1 permease [Ureibacillus sinduriensis BLB-1 = JCM 15800]